MRNEFTIKNGKVLNYDGYDSDFHYFREGRVLTLYLFIPGTKPKSLQIFIEGKIITFTVFFMKDIVSIVKNNQLIIKGKLPLDVYENTYSVNYENGVYIVNLSIKV